MAYTNTEGVAGINASRQAKKASKAKLSGAENAQKSDCHDTFSARSSSLAQSRPVRTKKPTMKV